MWFSSVTMDLLKLPTFVSFIVLLYSVTLTVATTSSSPQVTVEHVPDSVSSPANCSNSPVLDQFHPFYALCSAVSDADALKLMQPPSDFYAGDTVLLNCTTSADSLQGLSFSRVKFNDVHSRKEIFTFGKEEKDPRFKIVYDLSTSSCLLIIKCLQESDSGRYACEAKKRDSLMMTSINLQVRSNLNITQFLEVPLDAEYHIGDTVVLNCTTSPRLYRTFSVNWLKYGTNPLDRNSFVKGDDLSTFNPRYSVQFDPMTSCHSLVIRDVQQSDSGVYSCEAKSKCCTSESFIKIRVLPK